MRPGKKLDRAGSILPSIPKELVARFLTGPMTGAAIDAARIVFRQALIEASLFAQGHLAEGICTPRERCAIVPQTPCT